MPLRPALRPLLGATVLTALTALTALAVLSGCSSSHPAPADLVRADALPAGSCRQAAAPLNVVHRQVADLQADGGRASAARQPLSGATRDLQAAASAGGSGDVPARLDELVQAVGYLRLGIDTHSYDATLLQRTDAAARRLAVACRAG